MDTTTITNTTMSNEETDLPSDQDFPGRRARPTGNRRDRFGESDRGRSDGRGRGRGRGDWFGPGFGAVTSDPDSEARCSAGGPRSDEVT